MSLYCGTLSTWMPHSPNSARKAIPCGMKMWHGYRHSFINTSICWAATPLWYRNPWSAANSGHCALPRTRSLNLTASSVPLLLKPQNSTPQHQIIQTQRTVPYTPDEVYAAFADPSRLAKWWGPKDFINTFETFRVGGSWRFIMHGPDGCSYSNASVFRELESGKKIVIQHVSPPYFTVSVSLLP